MRLLYLVIGVRRGLWLRRPSRLGNVTASSEATAAFKEIMDDQSESCITESQNSELPFTLLAGSRAQAHQAASHPHREAAG